MKRIITLCLLVSTIVFGGCRLGTYSHSSGKSEKACVIVTADEEFNITVTIDGTEYKTKTIEHTRYKSRRDLQATAESTIPVSVGTHKVVITRTVDKEEKVLFDQSIFVSTQQTKNIEL